jgi:hypothetical protein
MTGAGTIDSAAGTFDYDGTITGTGALTLDGPGDFDILNNITTPDTITANSNIGTLTFRGTAITTANGNLDLSSGITLTNTGTVTLTADDSGANTADLTLGGATWTGSNTLALVSVDQIDINDAVSGINGKLTLSAVDGAASISTNSSGSIDVYDFDLLAGRWYQDYVTLPGFNVRNDFTFRSGAVPLIQTGISFIRVTGGNGTVPTPYTIEDVYALQGIAISTPTLIWEYDLVANIDASPTANWNGGKGFYPIGDATTPFATELNGDPTGSGASYTISNLYINRPTQNYIGIFGKASSAAVIKNFGLVTPDITGQYLVGGIIGHNLANVDNIYVDGGYVSGSIEPASGAPLSSGRTQVGGVIGYNEYAAGAVEYLWNSATVSGYNTVGGVLGWTSKNVFYSYNLGTVIAFVPQTSASLVNALVMSMSLANL